MHIQFERYYGHFSGDADTYRTTEEKEALRRDKDCLKNFRARVTEAGLLEADVLDAVDAEVNALIDESVHAARAAAGPDVATLTTDVYLSYP